MRHTSISPSAAPAAGAEPGADKPTSAAPGSSRARLADQLGREGEHAEHAPAEGVAQPQQHDDRHEQRRAQPEPASRPSRSHSPNRQSASPIESAKLTKPNWNGKP